MKNSYYGKLIRKGHMFTRVSIPTLYFIKKVVPLRNAMALVCSTQFAKWRTYTLSPKRPARHDPPIAPLNYITSNHLHVHGNI